MKTIHLSAALLASCALAATMFAPAYMKLGDIKGEATDKDHKDWIIIDSMSSPVSAAELRESPTRQSTGRDVASGQASGKREAASGLPTGKRQHKPFVVTKSVDKASPKLAELCAKGEVIPKVEIGDGATTYKLHDVIITSVTPSNSSGSVPMETLSLNYSKIEWNRDPEQRAVNAVERTKTEKPVRAPN